MHEIKFENHLILMLNQSSTLVGKQNWAKKSIHRESRQKPQLDRDLPVIASQHN